MVVSFIDSQNKQIIETNMVVSFIDSYSKQSIESKMVFSFNYEYVQGFNEFQSFHLLLCVTPYHTFPLTSSGGCFLTGRQLFEPF
jgi:hypothetical protein